MIDRFEGTAESVTTFQELDSNYGLKLPALFHVCLDPLTQMLSREFDFFGMARRGIAPITYYLELSSTGIPLALGRPLNLQFTVELFRADKVSSDPLKAPQQRLLLDQKVTVHGYHRSGSDKDLGFDDGEGEPAVGGAFRLIQIFTRPLAPPGQRDVSEVPPEFGRLREKPFSTPLMMPQDLWQIPQGYRALSGEGELSTQRVWSRGNTDINHHVTVTEYLRALELHHAQLLHHLGKPVKDFRLERMRCIFRRPSFAGDVVSVLGDLFSNERSAQLHCSISKHQEDGALASEPSVACCIESVMEGE